MVRPSLADHADPDEAASDGDTHDLDPSVGGACIAEASDAPFPTFIAPSGSNAFRQELARRVADLDCCLTPLRRVELDGARLELTFEPLGEAPENGAQAVLGAPLDRDRAHESECLETIVGRWIMTPAPVSDVVRAPLDPNRSSPAAGSVVIRYPWRTAERTRAPE